MPVTGSSTVDEKCQHKQTAIGYLIIDSKRRVGSGVRALVKSSLPALNTLQPPCIVVICAAVKFMKLKVLNKV